jgi:hypothetical protein
MGHQAINPSDTASLSSLSSIVIPLLKGVVYRESDDGIWNNLLILQARVRDYVSVIGLALVLDESEGYAFLRSNPEISDESVLKLPRLVVRRPLSFSVSLLLALLRKKMAEFDAGGADTRLVLSRSEVVDLIRIFMPEGSNDSRIIDQVDAHLNKIAELGFVRPLRGQEHTFEVRRILKAFVDAQWLSEFDERLSTYRKLLSGSGERDGNDE